MASVFLLLVIGLLTPGCRPDIQEEVYLDLFNGESLDGWEGDPSVFRVVDGAIVGGTLDSPIARTEFLCTTERFADFELRITARIEGNKNAGVQFRSERVPGSSQVAGYQADMGFIPKIWLPLLSDVTPPDTVGTYPIWGSLLDEFRDGTSRYPDPELPFWLLTVADQDIVSGALRPDDWNEVSVTAIGPRIEIGLNGTRTVEFVEEENLSQTGVICLQVHDGPPSMAWYKDIKIRQLSGEHLQ
jgi:hypothetical protein